MSAVRKDPLDGLENVNWAQLHHAYGAATDVPGQLRALASPAAEERDEAYYQLYGNVYHQGTRWQASSHVIPFLAALVDDPATPQRAAVISLLSAIAIGDRDDTHLPFNSDQQFGRAETVTSGDVDRTLQWLYGGAGEDGVEPDDVFDAVALSWDRDAYRAAASISDRFASWTADADQAVAAQAAELLAWFPATHLAITALLAVPETPGHELARASANLTLGYLASAQSAIDQRLTNLLTTGTYGIQLTAAIALALRQGDQIPDKGLQTLIEARDHTAEIHAASFPIPWNRSLLGFSSLALQQIGLAP